jgi:hypothetical protein
MKTEFVAFVLMVLSISVLQAQDRRGLYHFQAEDSTFYYFRFHKDKTVRFFVYGVPVGIDLAYFWLRNDSVDLYRGLCGLHGSQYYYELRDKKKVVYIENPKKEIRLYIKQKNKRVILDGKEYELFFTLNKGETLCGK